MDLQTMLVGTVIVLLSVLPIFIFNQIRKNKGKKRLLVLSNLAKQHNGIITNYETEENWSIGLDNQDILTFIQHGNSQTLNLKEIQRCKTNFSNRIIKQDKMQYTVVEDVSLIFEPIDKQKSVQIIQLYNVERDEHGLADELRQSEKWQKIIAQRIDEIKKQKTSK